MCVSDHGGGELAGKMMCADWTQPQEPVWTTEEQKGKDRKSRREGRKEG